MSVSAAGATTPVEERRGVDVAGLLGRFAPVIFLLLVMAFFSFFEPGFRTTNNLLNIVRAVSFFGILAVGMTFVILTAGIDLSVGSMLAFCGIVCASAAKGSRGAPDRQGRRWHQRALCLPGRDRRRPADRPDPRRLHCLPGGSRLHRDARRPRCMARGDPALVERAADQHLLRATSPTGARATSARSRCR